MTNIYKSQFGELLLGQGPEDNFVWTGHIDISNHIFSGQIPIYILTKERVIPNDTIKLTETIVLNIHLYLEKSISFIKQTFTAQPDLYKIRKAEYDLLNLDTASFPLNFPELTFWEGSNEWMMRFAEGDFYICDPFGISVTYSWTDPIRVDNLEDSEYIDH